MHQPRNSLYLTVFLALLVGTALSVTHHYRLLQPLEISLLNWQQEFLKPAVVASEDSPEEAQAETPHTIKAPVVLIRIDELSGEPWPWSRLEYALLINSIKDFNIRVLGLDVPLADSDPLAPLYDRHLSRQMLRIPFVVIGTPAYKTGRAVLPARQVVAIPHSGKISDLSHHQSAEWPHDFFARRARLGFTNLPPATSGEVQRVPLVFRYQNSVLPSYPLQLFATYIGADLTKSHITIGKKLSLHKADRTHILSIPLDERGMLWLNSSADVQFAGDIPFADVILASEQIRNQFDPIADLKAMNGGVVMLGRTVKPAARPVEGVDGEVWPSELHAQTVAQLLTGRYLTTLDRWKEILSIFGLALFAGLLGRIPYRLTALTTVIILSAACLGASFYFLQENQLRLPLVCLLVATLLAWSSSLLVNLSFIPVTPRKRKQPETSLDDKPIEWIDMHQQHGKDPLTEAVEGEFDSEEEEQWDEEADELQQEYAEDDSEDYYEDDEDIDDEAEQEPEIKSAYPPVNLEEPTIKQRVPSARPLTKESLASPSTKIIPAPEIIYPQKKATTSTPFKPSEVPPTKVIPELAEEEITTPEEAVKETPEENIPFLKVKLPKQPPTPSRKKSAKKTEEPTLFDMEESETSAPKVSEPQTPPRPAGTSIHDTPTRPMNLPRRNFQKPSK